MKSSADRWGRLATIVIPLVWLGSFFLVPFFIVARISVSQTAASVPPYAPHWEGFANLSKFLSSLSLDNYSILTSDSLYFEAYISSLRIAFLTTIGCLAVGYPLAYAIANASKRWQSILLTAVILPFWTSFLIRVYAWIGILKPEGFLDQALYALGVTNTSLGILNTDAAVIVGMVYAYLPFMIFPIYSSLEQFDRTLLEAAADLGAPSWKSFLTITLPLTRAGIVAGCLSVFIPAIGEFVVPDLLGGTETLMIGKVLWNEFFANRDWPVASAVAVVLLILLMIPMAIFRKSLLSSYEEKK
jgi:putrescine transport system permease protein